LAPATASHRAALWASAPAVACLVLLLRYVPVCGRHDCHHDRYYDGSASVSPRRLSCLPDAAAFCCFAPASTDFL